MVFSLSKISINIQNFGYPGLLFEKGQLLVQEMKTNNGALIAARTPLFKIKASITEVNQASNSSRKTVDSLELSLSEDLKD